MDVNRAQGIAPVGHQGEGGYEHPHKERREDGEEQPSQPSANAIEIQGLAAEMTPAVQQALDNLVAEIEPLRQKLAFAVEREQQLREDLAKHAFLPVPGRREFLRELNHVLNHLRDLTQMPSLAILHVANADEVRRRHGRDALDRFLVHAAQTIESALMPTDVLGSLGGNDFAIILLGADDRIAHERVAAIAAAVSETPFHGLGAPIAVELKTGAAELRKGMSDDAAIRDADRDLVR